MLPNFLTSEPGISRMIRSSDRLPRGALAVDEEKVEAVLQTPLELLTTNLKKFQLLLQLAPVVVVVEADAEAVGLR